MKKIFYFYSLLLIAIVVLNFMNIKDKKYPDFNDTEFNYENVSATEIGGYIDHFPSKEVSINDEILISGWGYDPQTSMPSQGIIIVINGKDVLPVEVYKIKRQDIVEAKSNKQLLKSGWETKFSADLLGKGSHNIEIFAVNEKGAFLPLLLSQSQNTKNTLVIK